jgi:hypothetical protein
MEDLGTSRAEWPEVTDLHPIQKLDQSGGETIPKGLMPRQRPSRTMFM